MKWKEELDRLPTDQTGRKEAKGSIASEIVFEFMKNEIYSRLRSTQDDLAKQKIQAAILPASSGEISLTQPSTYITVQRNSYAYTLQFKRDAGFDICVELNGKNGHKTFGTFVLDRTGESPVTFVENYLEEFRKQYIPLV